MDKIFRFIYRKEKLFNLLGLTLFSVALLVVIAWVSGYELESLAVLLAMLSSLSHAAPGISKAFLPRKKKLDEMSLDEISNLVVSTTPDVDWEYYSCSDYFEYFLKSNSNLKLRLYYDHKGSQNEDFRESWANMFSHKPAYGQWVEIIVNGQSISRIILVSVADGICYLPAPKPDTYSVTRLNFRIAEIFQLDNNLKGYFDRSGLIKEWES